MMDIQQKTLREKMKDIRAVLFDLDGTLIDSMWIWEQIDDEFLGKYGLPVPEDLHDEIEGMSFSETAVYFKNRFHLPLSLEEIKDIWNHMAMDKYLNVVPLKPGVPEFLDWMKAKGIPAGIATSNSRELVDGVLKARKLEAYFSCVATGCEVNAGKPAPDIYLHVAGVLSVPPSACMVFEDIPAGIRAGKSAGMTVTAIEDDFSAALREEKKRLADYYITDYRELI